MADGRRRSGEPRHESGRPAAGGRPPAAGSATAERDATLRTQHSALRTDEALPLPGQLSRLAALHRINRAATASLDLEEMLGTVVRVVAEAVGADTCTVYLYSPEEDTITVRATVGLNPAAVGAVSVPLGVGITGQAARTRSIIAAPDAPEHPDFVYDPLLREDSYRSHVSVPLLLGPERRLIGVLNIQTRERHEFDADELEFLRTVAGELAIAIENAQLYGLAGARLRRKVRELTTLQRVSATLASTLDLKELLDIVAEQACDLGRAQRVEIYRARGATPALLASNGDPAHPFEPAVVGRSLEAAMATPPGDGVDLPEAEGLLCVPLRSARAVLGGICLRFPPGRTPNEDQLALLRAFSNMAAVALENAELYEETRRALTVKSALLQEMHHRVRNNLQTVAALLSMQARRGGGHSWTAPLSEAVNRIGSIAAVHDLLSREDIGHTTVGAVAREVVDEVSATLVPAALALTFDVPEKGVAISSREATVLALLINELVANAVLHGMAGRRRGSISIWAKRQGDEIVLRVQDDGHGPPEGFDLEGNAGLGLTIARTLVRADLHGAIAVERNAAGGTTVTISFPATDGESGSRAVGQSGSLRGE
jgi:two-component sensor histidine kinase/putative methionine-R-sulfoxide reductase with GAF domain